MIGQLIDRASERGLGGGGIFVSDVAVDLVIHGKESLQPTARISLTTLQTCRVIQLNYV